MALLAPLFLLGGLLVALPIALHLTRRRRDPVAFPSFLLLQVQSAAARWKRRRFRNIPLLILRCLALALLALAFAEPVLLGEPSALLASSPRDLAVVVDRSLSMALAGRQDEALAVAEAELAELRSGERAVLVTFDDRAEARTELTEDTAVLRSALAGVAPGEGGTGISSALGLAARLLPEESGRRREVVLVSDLQRTGFEGGRPRPSLPPGVRLRVRPVRADPGANAWISEASVVPAGGDRLVVRAAVRFAPSSDAAERQVAMHLLLAGREVERLPVTLRGQRTLTVRFRPVLRPAEALPAELRLSPPDSLPGDDVFRFVLHPETAIPIADLGGSGRNLYLREALAVGTAPGFVVRAAPARGEAAVNRALTGHRVALVEEPGRLDAGAVQALAGFVAEGGGLVAAMGSRRLARDVEDAFRGLLPALPGGFVDRDPAGRLGDFLTRHPVFDPFAGPRDGVGLTTVPFFRYRALREVAAEAEVLARFDDGRPALLASSDSGGRVFLFASSLDARWNELPRRSGFVPFLHQLFAVAAGHEPVPVAYRVGETVDPVRAFRLGESAVEERILVDAPSGERAVLRGRAVLRLAEAGFFGARRPGSASGSVIAANPPLSESDLRVLEAEEVRIGAAAPPREADAPEESTGAAGLVRVPTAGFALLILLGLLAVEARAASTAAGKARASYTAG